MKLFIKRILSDATRSLRVPLPISIALELISTLQLIHLTLRVMTNYSDDKAFFFVALLNYGLSYIGQLSPTGLFYESESVLKYIWVIFAAYFVIHIVLLLYIFLFWKILRDTRQIRLLYFMHWLYLVHSRVIFFVAHFFFIGLLNLYNSGGNLAFYTKLAFFVPTVLFCVLNASLALIKELALYQLLKSRDSYGVKNNLYHQVILAHKGILIIIYFFVQDQPANAQVCIIMHVAFTILTLMVLYMKFPFYNILLMKTSIVLNGAMMAFCLLAILQILHVDKKVLDLVLLAVIPLVVKTTLIGFREVSHRIMKGEFDTPEKALYYISLLKASNFGYLASSLFEENPKFDTVISKGVLIHQKFDVSRLKHLESKKEYEEKIYQHVYDRLTTILEKNPSSKLLLLTMANICLKKLDNIPKTIILIKRLESQGLSIPANTSLDAFNLKLKQFHIKGDFEEDEKSLKMMNYFKYKEKAIALQQVMKQEVTNHIELWEEVKREHLDVKKVMDTAVVIDKSSALVQRIFETQFREFTQYFVNPLMLYGAYLELVKEYSDDARKLIKQFWSFTRSQARGQGIDVYCEEVGLVVISIEKTNLGNIVDASGSMQALFQLEKQRIIGKQITALLPDFMANYLNKIIKNYAKIPSRKLDHQINTYGKMPDGNYFEVQIQLKLFPKIDREVKLMLLFRKVAPPKPILILNHDGMIIEGTESLKQNLNITNPKNSAKEAFMRFQDIAPDFDRANTAFNQEYSAEQGGGLEILKSFSSKLPSVMSSKFYNASNTSKGGLIRQESLGVPLRDSRRAAAKHQDSQKNLMMGNQNTSMELMKDICNEYIQGTKIAISKASHTFSSSFRNEVVYDIKVIPCQVNGGVYKTLILTHSSDEEKQPSFLLPVIPKESTAAIFSKVSTEKSDFAEEFPDANERQLEISTAKFANYKATILIDKKVTLVSDDSSNPVKHKQSLKTPDLDPFIKAHAPTKGRLLAKLPEQENSISSTSSRTIASVKALKSIFGTGRTYGISRRTTIVMLLLVALMIGLGAYNYLVSRSAANQVKSGIGIVNTSSLRLSYAMRGWQFATRLWLRHIKLRSGQIDTLKASMLNAGLEMLEYNKEFNAELTELTDKSLIGEIMGEDVYLWELNQTYTTNGGSSNTFTASNIIANKMVMIGNTTMSTESDYILEQTLYLCNNTCNDYLVSSESLIAATQRMLQDTLSKNINSLQLILGLEIGTVGVICIVLLVSSRLVIEQYQKLFRALVRIDENYITERLYQVNKMKALLNDDIEVRGYGVSIIEESKQGWSIKALEKAKDGKTNVFRKGVFQKRSGRLILHGMFVEIAKYALVSLIFIQIVTALFIVSLSESLSNFRSSQDVTSQLAITTKAAYTSSVIISTVYMDMDFRNVTGMFVRNQAPVSQISKVISEFNDVNTDLISVFSKNGEGITDPLINELFESTICKYLAQDTTTQTYCVNATNYGQLGVLAINSKLLQTENYYVDKWLTTPTYDTAYGMLDAYIAIMRPAAETLQSSYEFINAHLVDKFDVATQNFLDKITVLHIGILIAVICSTIIMQKVTINRFELLDMQRGDILKTLSYKMLLEDKAIGFYLNRNFVNANGVLSKTL